MLLPEQVHRLFQLALVEFAPDWEISGACTELSLHRAEHWASGLGTFGLVLHNRVTGATKVLGRRTGELPNATYHRGISYRVLEAYADRITDPIRRYFEEIGVVAPPAARAPWMSSTSSSPTCTALWGAAPTARSVRAKISGSGLRTPTSSEKVVCRK